MTENIGSSSANPSIHFGHQVRKQRKTHGWSIHELSKRAGIAVGYLSLIENGKRPPNERTAAKIDAVFPERDGWFTDFYNDSQRWSLPGYRHWFEYEDRALHIWAWSPGMVHGLAQTPEYARAYLETVPGVSSDQVEARLKARMERQKRILHRDQPPTVWLLVDELALLRLVGSAEVVALQLAHLLDVARLPHVTVHVVPAVVHAVVGSEVIVVDDAAYAEHIRGGYVYLDDESAMLMQMITGLQADCYRASESIEIIERVKAIWESGESPLTAMLRADRVSKWPTAGTVS